MAEQENSKDLISVLWSGADILRSKMDANEYKDYLLGIVFYKYLSDSFLIKVYDLILLYLQNFQRQQVMPSSSLPPPSDTIFHIITYPFTFHNPFH